MHVDPDSFLRTKIFELIPRDLAEHPHCSKYLEKYPALTIGILSIHAKARGDDQLVQSLNAYGETEQDECRTWVGRPDLALLEQIRILCSPFEANLWAWLLASTFDAGDRNRKTMVEEMMRTRVAS